MLRRSLLSLALGCPLVVQAQTRTTRIGFVLPGSAETHGAYVEAFRAGIAERIAGGRGVEVLPRFALGSAARAEAHIQELLAARVAVLAVGSTDAALLAKKLAGPVPVVFAVSDDPVRMGLAQSLARPGGTMTGVSLFANELISKQLELVTELAPGAASIAMLVNGRSASLGRLTQAFAQAAQVRNRATHVLRASTEEELEQAFAALRKAGSSALLVPSDPFLNASRATIVGLAARHRIPAMYTLRDFASGGGLASYGIDYVEAYRQAGTYAARIVNGDAPAELPVLQPHKFEFVLNLATARALQLQVPASLRISADVLLE
ncbi:MAG TPA: ABC transporter substrate-binding protein [Ramlibacter sp.]|nr:ABC transporter substrate-binding protein [Ramlibacter sp.]